MSILQDHKKERDEKIERFDYEWRMNSVIWIDSPEKEKQFRNMIEDCKKICVIQDRLLLKRVMEKLSSMKDEKILEMGTT